MKVLKNLVSKPWGSDLFEMNGKILSLQKPIAA